MLVERPDRDRRSRDGARDDCRPDRHALTRGEGAPPGRRSRRACLLARVRSGASGGRSRSGCTPSSGRSSYDASSDRPSPERTSTSSAMRSSAMSPTSRSRDPSVQRCIARAAEWIESLGRPDDHAETLAHHYAAALEFARVSGQDVGDLPDRAQSAARRGRRSCFRAERVRARRAFLRARARPDAARTIRPARTAPARTRPVADGWPKHAAKTSSWPPARLSWRASDREGAAEAEALLVEGYWGRGQRESAAAHLERASSSRRRARAFADEGVGSLHAGAKRGPRERPHRGAARIAR